MSNTERKLALEKFAKVKELCDKHGSKINRKHVYGAALVEHFDVVCQALAEQPPQSVQLTPEWIWTWLMDWCKRNGTSPAAYDSLFKLVSDSRALKAAAPCRSTGIGLS